MKPTAGLEEIGCVSCHFRSQDEREPILLTRSMPMEVTHAAGVDVMNGTRQELQVTQSGSHSVLKHVLIKRITSACSSGSINRKS